MPPAVERMWLYLRRERLSPISAADVLRASGLRPTRAHLVFRAYFSETPHRMLTRHRLEYARHLLLMGGKVAAVATACGFRTRAHLTAAFRQEHGASRGDQPAAKAEATEGGERGRQQKDPGPDHVAHDEGDGGPEPERARDGNRTCGGGDHDGEAYLMLAAVDLATEGSVSDE